MKETRFTPGPWFFSTGNIGNGIEADSGKRLYDSDNGHRMVATVQECCCFDKYDDQEANRIANMHLVAAAPCLYAALENLREQHVDLLRATDRYGADEISEEVAEAVAALAKARGES